MITVFKGQTVNKNSTHMEQINIFSVVVNHTKIKTIFASGPAAQISAEEIFLVRISKEISHFGGGKTIPAETDRLKAWQMFAETPIRTLAEQTYVKSM